jgi:hypothetical protein
MGKEMTSITTAKLGADLAKGRAEIPMGLRGEISQSSGME